MVDIDKYLLSHARLWNDVRLNGIKVDILLANSNVASRPVNPSQKSWFDSSDNTLYVKLSSVKNESELDSIIISGVIAQRGLLGFMSESQLRSLGKAVFNSCSKQEQESLLAQTLGVDSSDESLAVAGRLHITNTAKNADRGHYKSEYSQAWFEIANLNVKKYMGSVASFMALSKPSFANAVGAGIRQHLLLASNKEVLGRYDTSHESIKNEILKLAEREDNRLPIDRTRVIKMGALPETLIKHSDRLRGDALLELPYSAFYGLPERGAARDTVVIGVDHTKKDKHPFPLTSIMNIKRDLEDPLAVFISKRNERTTNVMLPCRVDAGNFYMPITPKEILFDRFSGRHVSPGSGRWINNIDSIYPKDDLNIIFLLAEKRLVRYLCPDFNERWLKPAVEHLDALCREKARRMGAKLPTDQECKKILLANPVSKEDVSEGPIERLLSATELIGPSGFLREYAEYRVALESATKVVKEFESQKDFIELSTNMDVSSEKNLHSKVNIKDGQASVERKTVSKYDAAVSRIKKYFEPHFPEILERTGIDMNRLMEVGSPEMLNRLSHGKEVLLYGRLSSSVVGESASTREVLSFRLLRMPEPRGWDYVVYGVQMEGEGEAQHPRVRRLPEGEPLVLNGHSISPSSAEYRNWNACRKGIVIETRSGVMLVTPRRYDMTAGVAKSVESVMKRIYSIGGAELMFRTVSENGAIGQALVGGFYLPKGPDAFADMAGKLSRGGIIELCNKDGQKTYVRFDCGENGLVECPPVQQKIDNKIGVIEKNGQDSRARLEQSNQRAMQVFDSGKKTEKPAVMHKV